MKDHVRKNLEENLIAYQRMARTLKGDEKAYAEKMVAKLSKQLKFS